MDVMILMHIGVPNRMYHIKVGGGWVGVGQLSLCHKPTSAYL